MREAHAQCVRLDSGEVSVAILTDLKLLPYQTAIIQCMQTLGATHKSIFVILSVI